MQLHERYPDRVHAITLNVDFDSDGKPTQELQHAVASTLAADGVVCENVLCSDRVEDVLADFGIYSLPAALIFDIDGNLLRRFDGIVDYEGVILPLIDELVVESETD